MKYVTKTVLTTTALAALAATTAHATQITGSIGFGATAVALVGGTSLATATSFTLTDPTVEGNLSGNYTGIGLGTSVSYTAFTFNPPVGSVTPLWTVTAGGITYTFDATSVMSSFNFALDEWDIGGAGMAMATGFTATPGTWNMNLSQSGATVVFDSSATVSPSVSSVSDGGSTLMMLGAGLVGLVGVGRKLRC